MCKVWMLRQTGEVFHSYVYFSKSTSNPSNSCSSTGEIEDKEVSSRCVSEASFFAWRMDAI
ncbi:hypothetical protein ACU8KH_03639 [Lachancea thermotolerans]